MTSPEGRSDPRRGSRRGSQAQGNDKNLLAGTISEIDDFLAAVIFHPPLFSGKEPFGMDFRKLLTPRWIFTTLLVIVAVGVMVRLGIWQLDRLQERRASNAKIEAQINAPALDLNNLTVPANALPGMEYRPVTVRGTFDPKNEIVLRNQVYNDQPGYHLLTPLHIQGSSASILIDRGFIPLDQAKPEARAQYAQNGTVEIKGIIRLPYVPRFFGVPDPTLAPGQTRLDAWNYVSMDRLQQQVSYPLLPVYVEAAPDPARTTPPIGTTEQPDLSEGPHMGYAIQWFSFAAILAAGYPFFVKKQISNRESAKDAKKTAQRKKEVIAQKD